MALKSIITTSRRPTSDCARQTRSVFQGDSLYVSSYFACHRWARDNRRQSVRSPSEIGLVRRFEIRDKCYKSIDTHHFHYRYLKKTARTPGDCVMPRSINTARTPGAGTATTPTAIDSHPPSQNMPEERTQKPEEKEKTQKFLPYPHVKTPTPSAVKRRRDELDKEKKQKIAEGFYQEHSDEDDTLEKVKSLKMEQSDASKKGPSARLSLVGSVKRKVGNSKLLTARAK